MKISIVLTFYIPSICFDLRNVTESMFHTLHPKNAPLPTNKSNWAHLYACMSDMFVVILQWNKFTSTWIIGVGQVQKAESTHSFQVSIYNPTTFLRIRTRLFFYRYMKVSFLLLKSHLPNGTKMRIKQTKFLVKFDMFLVLSAFPDDVVKWHWETKNAASQTLRRRETGDYSPEELNIAVIR